MKTIEIISQDVFDKIRSRFQNLEMGDENGGVTMDPRQARFFDFDFVIEDKNLGRVSISINELGTLKLFYSKSILESADDNTQHIWYKFLKEMRNFAMRRLLRFDTRDITKSNLDKNDFQYLASKSSKEENMNMSESIKFQGGKKTSYRVLEKTKLIAKHHNNIEDESYGARSRPGNIKALYIENAEGERFKYPFIHVAGAKAMQRHVANGGRPYDDLGGAIVNMSEQIAQLTAFRRHVSNHDGMNKEVNEIAERAGMKLESLRNQLHSLSKQHHYEAWSESFQPTAHSTMEMDQATMEDYKAKFTVSSFKEDLAQYFPLIHSIMQEAGEINLEDVVKEGDEEKCEECGMWESKCTCGTSVKENYFTKFTEWADAIVEGRVEPDALIALKELLDQGITVGVDGTAGIEALEGIGISDEELQKLIEGKAAIDPDTPLSEPVGEWLVKEDPEAAQEFGLVATSEPTDESMNEAPEDRSSYQVARYLFDKGARYEPHNEQHLIKMIGGAMMKLGYDHKTIRRLMNYDEDFLSDTLGELRHMEQAVDEVGMSEAIASSHEVDPKKNPDVPAYLRKQMGADKLSRDDVKNYSNRHKYDFHQRAHGEKHPEDTREDENEDAIIPKDSKMVPEGPDIKKIAEMVKSFYNRNHKEQGLGPFPKGEEGVIIHIKKELGDDAGKLAEKFVAKLSGKADEDMQPGPSPSPMMSDPPNTADYDKMDEFIDIMKLAGLAK
jgi:hypothetical protein